MNNYVIGVDLAKPDTVDNSVLRIETIVSKLGDVESYVNKPVTLNDKVIGVVINAVEVESGYKLSMTIWLRTIKSCRDFINNGLSTISIR